ncbi:MAG: hypothetical protein M3R14_00870 [Acidobacteriota bacterium]|nr:hypothetical protein [Acidobacteriota bacterium]
MFLCGGENLSAEEAFEFASVATSSNIGLEDTVSLQETVCRFENYFFSIEKAESSRF